MVEGPQSNFVREGRKEDKMKTFNSVMASLVLATGLLTAPVIWADSHTKGAGFISVEAFKLKWSDAPSVGPGAKIAVLEGDLKAAAPFTFRLKVPANSKVGVHTHPTAERVTILSGTLYFAIGDKYDAAKAKEYKPGDAFMVPPGIPMYAYTKKGEVIVQIHGTGPWGISYNNPADDPSKKK
jgi:quercetin dioxygenase-like cupin family protein